MLLAVLMLAERKYSLKGRSLLMLTLVEVVVIIIEVIIRLNDQCEDRQDERNVVEGIGSTQYSIHIGTGSEFFLLTHVHGGHVALSSLNTTSILRPLKSCLESNLFILGEEKSFLILVKQKVELLELEGRTW